MRHKGMTFCKQLGLLVLALLLTGCAQHIQCDGGRIDVTITPEDGEPIYTGKRLPTSSFSIVPKTPGKYTVTISGENASGSVYVYVEGAVHYDDEPAENK